MNDGEKDHVRLFSNDTLFCASAHLGLRVVVAQSGLVNGEESKQEKQVGNGCYTGYFTH